MATVGDRRRRHTLERRGQTIPLGALTPQHVGKNRRRIRASGPRRSAPCRLLCAAPGLAAVGQRRLACPLAVNSTLVVRQADALLAVDGQGPGGVLRWPDAGVWRPGSRASGARLARAWALLAGGPIHSATPRPSKWWFALVAPATRRPRERLAAGCGLGSNGPVEATSGGTLEVLPARLHEPSRPTEPASAFGRHLALRCGRACDAIGGRRRPCKPGQSVLEVAPAVGALTDPVLLASPAGGWCRRLEPRPATWMVGLAPRLCVGSPRFRACFEGTRWAVPRPAATRRLRWPNHLRPYNITGPLLLD